MPVLFLIVFVDILGFGLLLPLLPFYVQRMGAGPEVITAVLGLYSLAQVIAAPLWGRLSDRYGRKPILAITCVGLGLSYVVLAFADSLALVIVSRIVGGLMAGNIAAAQAYVADVTAPETRAKGMGILGAAFGLGFIVGPSIGGLFAGVSVEGADYRAPALAAMTLSFIAAAGAALFLKESLSAETRTHMERRATFGEKLRAARRRRTLLMLVVTGFLIITAWAQFETVFALWVHAAFGFGPREIGFVFGFMGAVNVLVQGALMGALTRRFGEKRLVPVAGVLFISGYLAVAVSATLPMLILSCAALAFASALFNPSATSLVSQEAASGERGAVMGAYQSATALGRVAGPSVSGTLFAAGMTLPYLAAAALAGFALALFAFSRKRAE
ncbi:MAG: MFS transporter [Rhodospirillaceae bacterium]|nr:MFS transporter [Rhodospirillaceae bacterium]